MAEKTIAQKNLISQATRIARQRAERLPIGAGSTAGANQDRFQTRLADRYRQAFVTNRKELEEKLPKIKSLLAPHGILWLTYLKGTSNTKTDINRDTIYSQALILGLKTAAMLSIDANWSAMRMKRIEG
jgi:hypothetical protein